MRVLAAAVLLVLVTSCGGGEPAVDWARYDSTGFHDGIAQAIRDKDCQALQGWFDAADKSDASYRQRDGKGNAALLSYIDWHMRQAGCFGK